MGANHMLAALLCRADKTGWGPLGLLHFVDGLFPWLVQLEEGFGGLAPQFPCKRLAMKLWFPKAFGICHTEESRLSMEFGVS